MRSALELREARDLDSRYETLPVAAPGRPAETVILEDMQDSIKYHRDEQGIHHVPEYRLGQLRLD